MKTQTGIIRRMDDLGRIVIPKALRDQLKVEEGQPFEISLTKNGFELEVYKPEPDKKAIATNWLESNRLFISQYSPHFYYYKNLTCCVIVTPSKNFTVCKGIAKRAEGDNDDIHIGEIISFCRAIGRSELIPREFFK